MSAPAGRTVGRSPVLAGLVALTLLCGGCDGLRSTAGRVEHGRAQLADGDALAAIATAKRVIEKDPQAVAARLLLADAALQQNDRDTVRQQLDKARESGASAVQLMPREWALLRQKNDFEGLQKSVGEAGADVPEADRAHYLGAALLGLHQQAKAVEAFKRALALEPDNADVIVGLAQATFLTGDRKTALESLKAARQKFSKDPRVALALGQAYTAAGQTADAEVAFHDAAKLASPRGDAGSWLVAQSSVAQLALSQGHYADADQAVAALAKAAPNVVGTRMLQARLALAERRLDEASRYAQAVVQAVPGDVSSRMLLAYITYSQGYMQQAESSLDDVLQERPDYPPARKLLAEIQLASNRPEIAKRTLEPLLGATADGETLSLAGRIATVLGERTEADGYYGRAVDAAGASDSLKLKIAAQYLAAGKQDRAVEILGKLPGGSDLAQRRDLLLALAKGANQSPEAARAAIDQVAAKYVDDPALQRSVAILHAARGDYDAARAKLVPVLKAHPDDVETLLTLARIESAAKRYDEAAKALTQVLAKEPKNQTALIESAAIALLRGDGDSAIKALETARAADPTAIEPRLSLARIYLSRDIARGGSIEAARGPIKEALALAPKRVDVLILASVAEKRSGHDAEAERILRDAIASDSATPALWLSLGELQAAEEHLAEARDSFRKAIALKPGWLPAVKALAAADVRNGDFADALDLTYKAREVGGQANAQAREQRAGALMLEGDIHASAAVHTPAIAVKEWTAAAQAYASSYESSPSFASAARALQARAAANLPDAPDLMAGYVRTHPSDVMARGVLGNYLESHGERAKAIATYEAGLALSPTQPVLLNNLAWLYSQAKDPRALETAQRAVQYSQRQPAIVDTLGWILVQQGKTSEGLAYVSEAHKAQVKNPEITYHYAYAVAKAGNVAEALSVLTALLADPRAFPSRKDAESLKTSLEAGAAGH